MHQVFEHARKNRPCIIFLDEIDSIGGARTDSSSGEAARRVLTELLKQMDGVGSGSNEGVTVVAATNRPAELDSALRRRFEKRV
jgi:vacuolar protein-sorting-associated protein 4